MKEVDITTEFIKLDQFLKWAGIAYNGGEAKAMVMDGFVKVNEEIILQRGKKLYKGDKVHVNGHGDFIIV